MAEDTAPSHIASFAVLPFLNTTKNHTLKGQILAESKAQVITGNNSILSTVEGQSCLGSWYLSSYAKVSKPSSLSFSGVGRPFSSHPIAA